MIKLINCDVLDFLKKISNVKTIFIDPPDNIGLNYDIYNDKTNNSDYYNWLYRILLDSLQRAEIIWLSYYWKHDLEIKNIIREILKYRYPSFNCKTFIWRFTFGQYMDNDCSSGYRPIARLTRFNSTLYPDNIREKSARMLAGDSRAAGLRVPDDVWLFPRIVGNCHERRTWHPTQHPEKLLERIIKFSCNDTEIFVDLFAGSGTSIRVCKRLGINCIGVELSKFYCSKILEENLDIEFETWFKGESNAI